MTKAATSTNYSRPQTSSQPTWLAARSRRIGQQRAVIGIRRLGDDALHDWETCTRSMRDKACRKIKYKWCGVDDVGGVSTKIEVRCRCSSAS